MASAAVLEIEDHMNPHAVQPQASGRPVDLVHLSRFTLGDDKLQREVLQLFRVQANLFLERLESAGDVTKWHEAAHTIKGSARGIGAWSVAKAAEGAEQLNGPASKRAAEALDALRSAVCDATKYIDRLLAEH